MSIQCQIAVSLGLHAQPLLRLLALLLLFMGARGLVTGGEGLWLKTQL